MTPKSGDARCSLRITIYTSPFPCLDPKLLDDSVFTSTIKKSFQEASLPLDNRYKIIFTPASENDDPDNVIIPYNLLEKCPVLYIKAKNHTYFYKAILRYFPELQSCFRGNIGKLLLIEIVGCYAPTSLDKDDIRVQKIESFIPVFIPVEGLFIFD